MISFGRCACGLSSYYRGFLYFLMAEICGLDLVGYYQSVLDKRLGRSGILLRSRSEVGVPWNGSGVGRGNKFVLLDITEEPEAKKAYSIQHKRNLMKR
jgi:hypothetical protein